MDLIDALDAAAAASTAHLATLVDEDWSQPAAGLDWTCRRTAGHLADALYSYANQLAVQAQGAYVPLEAVLEDRADAAGAVQAIAATTWLLAAAARTAGPDARAFHPRGVADPAGFCALAVVEVCCHTDDIGRGLGAPFTPPAAVVEAAVRRLWPDHPTSPAQVDLAFSSFLVEPRPTGRSGPGSPAQVDLAFSSFLVEPRPTGRSGPGSPAQVDLAFSSFLVEPRPTGRSGPGSPAQVDLAFSSFLVLESPAERPTGRSGPGSQPDWWQVLLWLMGRGPLGPIPQGDAEPPDSRPAEERM